MSVTQYRSEVARIREQIVTEQMAAKLGLQGLNTGTSRHSVITRRQENIGALHEELQDLVGPDAIALVAETLNGVPDAPARSDILAVARRELGQSEETEHLCHDLQGVWNAVDMLVSRFGDK